MSSMPEAEVILTVDVGSENTRASLFDVVDGSYRLIATACIPSTNRPPFLDMSEGVQFALEEIQAITGRRIVDDHETLILPTTGYGEGIDALVGSISGGPPVRAVLAGLMPDISLASARRLADSMALHVVAEITPADERLQEEQIDAIVAARPDIILLVGGTDQGARGPLLRLIDIIGLAVSLIPERQRPQVVFAGNPTMTTTVVERLAERTQVSMILIVIFSFFTPTALIFGHFLLRNLPEHLLGAAVGLASGTFLYVALLDLLPEVFHHPERKWMTFGALVVGISIIAAIVGVGGHAH